MKFHLWQKKTVRSAAPHIAKLERDIALTRIQREELQKIIVSLLNINAIVKESSNVLDS